MSEENKERLFRGSEPINQMRDRSASGKGDDDSKDGGTLGDKDDSRDSDKSDSDATDKGDRGDDSSDSDGRD